MREPPGSPPPWAEPRPRAPEGPPRSRSYPRVMADSGASKRSGAKPQAGTGRSADAPRPAPRTKPAKSQSRRPTRMPKIEETSAGGLVVDRSGDLLRAALIARHDRRGRLVWSLPKGHLEAGETPEDAAVREVEEETGIRGRVLAPLGVIDFWFIAENRRIHKTVHHYLMEASGGELSDEDAEVVEVAWFPLTDVRERLAYADERRLLDRLPDLLADAG